MVGGIFLRKARRDLWGRKGSLAALLIIVTLGIGVFQSMSSVYRDLDGARERYYREHRLADFQIQMERAPRWALDAAARLPNVREVRGRVRQAALIDLPGSERPVSGVALSLPEERRFVINGVFLRTGMWFSGRDNREVIVDHAFAGAHGIRPGSRIRVLLLDKQHELLVTGTAMSPEFVYLIPPGGGLVPDPSSYGVLYMREEFLRESSNLEGAFNEIVGIARDPSPNRVDALLDNAERVLDPYGVTQAMATRDVPSVRFLADELTGLRVSSRVMPGIFLAVAAMVLNILMGRMVQQQRQTIGTLRALGYTSRAVGLHFLSYGWAVGLAGSLCGMAFGYWLQGVYVDLYKTFFAMPGIERHAYADIIALSVLIGIGFATLGTLGGVRRAAALQPAEAMHPPPPEKGAHIWPERFGVLWRRLSFRHKMILRSVFRNPFRGAVGIFASVISTALIMMSLCNIDALNYLMDYEFNQIAHQDLTASLRDPVGLAAMRAAESIPGVSRAEPQLGVPCELSAGTAGKRTGVTGLVRGRVLYTPLEASGMSAELPRHGLILSEKLAELLRVKPGDRLRMRPLIGERREVTAAVAGTVDSFLGLSAYADIEYLSRLIGEEWAANSLLIAAHNKEDLSEPLSELKRRPAVTGIGERLRSLLLIDKTFGDTMGAMIGAMVLFSGLIAFGSVVNTALVTLSERQREVGTLRVLGYTPRQAAGLFSGESYLVNGLGVFLGLFAGWGLSHLLAMAYSTELYRFPVVIMPSRPMTAVAVMAGFIWLAQWIVRRLIRKLDWLRVLGARE